MSDSASIEPDNPQAARVAVCGRVTVTIIILALLGLIGRVVQLKTAPDPRLLTAAGTTFSTRAEMQRRGDIQDRRGRIIATSTAGYRLFVDPSVVEDISTLAVRLAELLDADPIEIDRAIQARLDRRYAPIVHLLADWQVEAIRAAKLPGVGLEPRLVRHYPHQELGASVIGLVGFEHSGLAGAERVFEPELEAHDGRLTYLRDVRRRPLWIEPDDHQPGATGEDIRLSIDLVIQDLASDRLRQAVEQYNTGGGRILVLDCKTGEILAMTDLLRQRPGWDEQTTDPGRAINPALGRNRCITDPYEPGSTFKPFVWSVATSLGKARPEEILPCPSSGPWRTSYGRAVRDSHYYGPVSWETVLLKSLNSGMAMVAERMTHRQMQDLIRDFGFGERTYSGLPGESPGIVTSRKDWSKYTQTSVSFGHEIAVTPLQMVRAFSVFARDGTMPAVRITALQPGPESYQFVHRVITEDAAKRTREAMRKVMLEGTGQRARSELYQIFGKSGTPQLPKKEGGGYHEDRYVPSFVAGAPYTDPRVVVVCVLDDPDRKLGHWGGEIAGPVVRDVIDQTLQYLGVAPDQPGAMPNNAVESSVASSLVN